MSVDQIGQGAPELSDVDEAQAPSTGTRRIGLLLGPAFIAAVTYVDPGNFATNIQGGSDIGGRLVWVVVAANLLAMIVQSLSAKLGLVTGRSLPELVRDRELGGAAGVLLAAVWQRAGVDAQVVTRDGPPDASVLRETRRSRADLVILSTHGRSGLVAWTERSIAARLIQTRGLTLVLLRARGARVLSR